MQEFPSNSQKAKAQTEAHTPVTPVTSAEGGRRKRGLGRQFKQTFFEGSSRDAVGSMVEDVVVPTIRDMIAEGFHALIDHMVFGDRPRAYRRSAPSSMPTSGYGQVSYNQYSQPQTKPSNGTPPRSLSRQARARHDYGDVIIPTMDEANEVLDRMYDIVSQYGVVRVSDLFGLTDIRAEHTDEKWGWTDLRGSKAVGRGRSRGGGYVLVLPEPQPLN